MWIPEILKGHYITDNSNCSVGYFDAKFLFKNHQSSISLQRTPNGRSWHNKEKNIWNFITNSEKKLNNILADKETIKNNVILFGGEEYEHNTNDNLFTLSGTGFANWTMQTGNLIGSITKDNYTLNVNSRFGDNFLKSLIADAEGFLEIEDYGSNSSGSYEWLLRYLWKIKLKKAYRLGLPKEYVSKKERLNKVRGNLDVLDFYQRNKASTGFLCSYREHSYENSINDLINTTFGKVKGDTLLSNLAPIRRAFETAVKGKKVKLKALRSISNVSNPYFNDYNDVISLSKRILKDELANFGEKSDLNAIFFDISMLFEYFIRKAVSREGVSINAKNESAFFIPSGGKYNSGERALYPDLYFEDSEGNTCLFDVKYKRYDFKHGVKREDLFQIYSYLGQITNEKSVKRFGFIYPLSEKTWKHQEENNASFKNGSIKEKVFFGGKELTFEVHFFKVPAQEVIDYKAAFQHNKFLFLCSLLSE